MWIEIVGLLDSSVKESKDLVNAALYAIDCAVPEKRIIINLSSAEQKKNSPIFDLAMAMGIMKKVGEMKHAISSEAAFLGILTLDGSIKPVDGILPAIIVSRCCANISGKSL